METNNTDRQFSSTLKVECMNDDKFISFFIHFILLQQSAVTSSSNSQWAGQKGYKALTTAHKVRKGKKSFPILVTERWARSWSRCTGSQPAGDVKWITPYTYSSSLPLLSARPAFTFVTFTRWRYLETAAHIWFQLTTHFIDPERIKGWVGVVGWPIADGLPTLVVTHQLQVERRTGKVRRPQTDVLPLCHVSKIRLTWVVPEKGPLNVCVCVCVSVFYVKQTLKCLYRFASSGGWGCTNFWFNLHVIFQAMKYFSWICYSALCD